MNSEANKSPESPINDSSLRPESMPDFILFGAQKCGTTAFQRALARHSLIFCSNPKEPNFFAYPEKLSHPTPYSLKTDVPTESAYRSLFSSAHDSQIRGEASISYFTHSQIASRIHHTLPQVKLIAILRQPVDRAYSSWLHSRHSFNEPIGDFLGACEASQERVAAGRNWNRAYLDTGFYARHLQKWFSLFPRSQFKIFLYEDWQHNPEKVLRETFQFLGVPPHASIDVTRDNVTSIRHRSAWLRSLLSPSRSLRSLVQRTLPASVRTTTTRVLRRINNGGQATPLAPSIRAKLTAQYETDISELEVLINRDLSAWRTTPRS